MVTFTDRLGNEQEISEEFAYDTFKAHRVYTMRDGTILVITAADELGEDLRLLGGAPSVRYSLAGGRSPESPLAQGFRAEREWKGFPTVFGALAREVANEQAAERGLLVSA